MSKISGTWKLIEDVTGTYSKKVYGKAGDWVEVVSDFYNMAIVQGADHSKFPVVKTNLSQDDLPAPVEETLKIMEETAPVPVNLPAGKAVKKKPAKFVTVTIPALKQQTFFD